ncbi:hypothetical protein [Paraburkholderia sp. SIMBA_030]|uniref:hypothetical protein n=1 Tax=Paraburkholderia sp. SIMBA_030 TaxID=3085773 RepID=UPI00397AFE01
MTDIPTIAGNALFLAADAAGKILYFGSVPQSMLAVQVVPEGGQIVEGVGYPATDYIVAGAITPRPANSATLDGMTLKNVPASAVVSVDATDYAVTDGTVELSFTQPGTYAVKVSAWPMLDATFEVTQA